jgi:coenzyme F420-reducing hydrogenase gamma subunit
MAPFFAMIGSNRGSTYRSCETLSLSTPVAHHGRVDFELRGCPVNKRQFLEVTGAFWRSKSRYTDARRLPGLARPRAR